MPLSSLPTSYYLLGGVVAFVGWYLVPFLYDPFHLRRSTIPGPKLAAISNLWLAYVSAKGHRSTSVHELHQRYGKLVRIAPDHVSIADSKAVETLYAHGSNGSLKSDFYDAFVSINDALFSTRNRAAHARKRKLVSAAFSLQNVLHFEPHVRRHIRLFFAQWDLRAAKAAKGSIEGARNGWSFFNVPSPDFNYLAFDIIGDLAFGKPFGMIPNQSDVLRYVPAISVLNGRGNYSASVGVLPVWIREWVRVMPWFAKGSQDVLSLAGMASAAVDRRLRFGVPEEEPLDDEEEVTSGGRTDLLEKLMQGKDEHGEPMGRDELTAEALTQMIAGSDTTSNSSCAITFHLAANPDVQRKLQAELDTVMPNIRTSHPPTDIKDPTSPPLPPAASVAKWADIKALPYLQAVISEGMRLHSTFGLGPPRIVPKGGLEICGERFKEGTILSVPSYSLHHNRELWGDDYESFKPERWFGREPGKEYNPFSFGPRSCVGRNLATLEMTIIIASIFHRYEFVLDHPGQKPGIVEGLLRKPMQCVLGMRRRPESLAE
ncbi:Cytochrome P450 monooxygenase [Rhizoctonia solani]|uniref:Cytochrome P450 monooxygenase n=1 Tax=Rhizoctonia solani TaxID=456999 RepID=A0A8H7IDT6_9AGAM|nr:Cytochrome P450 monooxygenase [Rhizoctonia solani]